MLRSLRWRRKSRRQAEAADAVLGHIPLRQASAAGGQSNDWCCDPKNCEDEECGHRSFRCCEVPDSFFPFCRHASW